MASAVAAVDTLRTTDLSFSQACKRVATTLNEVSFRNPHKGYYSAETIKGWSKRRARKNDGSRELIKERRSDFETVLEVCAERNLSQEAVQGHILLRLALLIRALSYGLE